MSIDLPADLTDYVRTAVARGEFPSEGELLADAVRLHRERAGRLAALRDDLRAAGEALDRGEGRTIRDEREHRAFFAEIERRGRERLAGGGA